ncbi:MAG: hypothetical protein HQ596_02605 [Candidatus Saganbacteria bacterium]|nr:hypothetical protein [Candidatus Saganbacteria bacterium]
MTVQLPGVNPGVTYSRANTSTSQSLGASFFERLYDKMQYILRVSSDSEVNAVENAFITGFSATGDCGSQWSEVESLTAQGLGGEAVYSDAAATLWATMEMNDIQTTLTFALNLISTLNDLDEKAGNLLTR